MRPIRFVVLALLLMAVAWPCAATAKIPTLNGYTMRDFRQTKKGEVLVTPFQLSSDLLVDGVRYQEGYGPRIATFVHGSKGWQIVSYAVFALPQTRNNP